MTAAKLHLLAQNAFRSRLLWLVVILLCVFPAARAQTSPPQPIISEIRITGNQRVNSTAIRLYITSRVGQPLNPATVDRDIKAIYGMGFFDQVSASEQTSNGRAILTYNVAERPLITRVEFEGMKAVKQSNEKFVNAVRLHAGGILDPARVEETIKGVKQVYQDKGYPDASITFATRLEASNTAVAIFHVTEGPIVEISAVKFIGNHKFSASELQSHIETRPHNLLSWLFGTGILDKKKLQADTDRLTSFYYNHGYLNVHVAEPEVTRHGNSLTVTFHIDEGPQYRVGTVNVAGDLKVPKKVLLDKLTVKPKQVFAGTDMQHDVLSLSEFYSNRGYAYVNVNPSTSVDPATRTVNVTYDISPGREVLVNRIRITGNTKTSDKVIRRELKIQEQEPYSTKDIQESKRRLDALGYFSSTQITTSPGPTPSKINLNVHVQEQNTASLQIGGGYDSYSSVFGNFGISNTNLFGGGESASATAQIGFLYQEYNLSYTEPWFLDMPLSVNLQLFYNKLYLYSFDQSGEGFLINSGYPLSELGFKKLGPFSLEHVTAGLGYELNDVGIGGFSNFTTLDIARYKGTSLVSEIMPSLQRFTVNNPLDPRTGSVQSLRMEIAGLGGTPFIKGVFHTHFFIPYIKNPRWGEWVFDPSVTYGIGTLLEKGQGSELPLYERFFPGGLGGGGDVRGYELYSLGPEVTLYNQLGQPFAVEQVGGSQELLLSGETTFPIIQAVGLRGFAFVDAGNAFRLHETPDITKLQSAYGVGFRWLSPFGPISVDVARPINPRPNDQSTVVDIGAGAPL